MTKRELIKRYVVFMIGLFFIALGIAFSKISELGVSPISSVPNVFSCKFTSITLGTWLILWNFVLIIAQILILRKDFKLIELVQIPLTFLFGYFADFSMWCVSFINVNTYAMQILMVIVGVVVLGFGVSVSVISKAVMNAGEAIVQAISYKLNTSFGNVKIAVDVSLVIVSIILSMLFFGGEIVGAREGTIILAVFTGVVVKIFSKTFAKPLDRILSEKNK